MSFYYNPTLKKKKSTEMFKKNKSNIMYTEVSNPPTMFREQCRVSLGVLKNEFAVHNDNKRD